MSHLLVSQTGIARKAILESAASCLEQWPGLVASFVSLQLSPPEAFGNLIHFEILLQGLDLKRTITSNPRWSVGAARTDMLLQLNWSAAKVLKHFIAFIKSTGDDVQQPVSQWLSCRELG